MGYGFKVELWGNAALFSRPELKAERCSYDMITASAARGILEAVFWHPGLRWRIDRIHVLNPIRFANVRRNEVKSKLSARNAKQAMEGADRVLFISTKDDIQQRASMILTDVRYLVEAHFELTKQAAPTDNADKFYAIARRRFTNGQCYAMPYFGCREFPANFRLLEEEEMPRSCMEGERDLGFMLYDLDYSDPADIRPVFIRAVLHDGILDLRECEVHQ